MGVYDVERYLEEAVDSVLAQTMGDLELILVDDASPDRSHEILASYDDPRMVVLRNARNLGHPASLNRALAAARAPFIARLDADDVAEPHRLERQLAEMKRRPELDVLGSWTVEVDEDGEQIGTFSFPPGEALIRWALARTNVVYHPSVLMRRSMLDRVGGYRAEIECADDYDLFTRVIMTGGRVDILPERLIRYRRSGGQISARRVSQQRAEAREVRRAYVSWLSGAEPSHELVTASAQLQARGNPPSAELLKPGVALQRAVQRGAAAGLPRAARRSLYEHTRHTLLHHATKLRESGRHRDAYAVWKAALGSGRGWTHDVLGEGFALVGATVMRLVARRP